MRKNNLIIPAIIIIALPTLLILFFYWKNKPTTEVPARSQQEFAVEAKPVNKISYVENGSNLAVTFENEVISDATIDSLQASSEAKTIIKNYLRQQLKEEQENGLEFIQEYTVDNNSNNTDQVNIYSKQTTNYQVVGNYLSIWYEKLADFGNNAPMQWAYNPDDYMPIQGDPPYQVNSGVVFDLTTGEQLTLADIFETEENYQQAITNSLAEYEPVEIMKEIYAGSFDDKLSFCLTADGVVFMFNPITISGDRLVEAVVPYNETRINNNEKK